MKTGKHIFCLIAGTLLFAVNAAAETSIKSLLEGYLRNDLTLQELSTQVGKEILEKDSTYLSNGMSFQLETGTISIVTGENTYMKFTPEAELTLPEWNNLTLTAGSTVQIGSSSGSSSADSSLQNTSLSLSADIISADGDLRKIELLKADRSVLEMQRKLQNQFVSAEKEFYKELESLYSIASEIVQAEKDLYEDQLTFEEVKAKDYRPSSSKYRTAQMDVLSDQHTVETAKHKLEREVKIFAAECGAEYNVEDAMDFLPTDIPVVEALDVLSFNEADYTEIESATWTAKINQMTRDSTKVFTLTGNAGYTFNNTTTSSDTVDVGAGFTWNATGLGVSAGVSLPVADSVNPVYKLALTFNPKTIKQTQITEDINELSAAQEQIEIDAAEVSYDTAVITQQTELADILWNKNTISEALDMYTSLEADTLNWYNQGIVTESEYRSTSVSKENYRIKSIINQIDMIIYNDETTLLFCRDQELNHEKEIK